MRHLRVSLLAALLSATALALPFNALPGRQVAVRRDFVTTPALRYGFYIYLPSTYVAGSGTTYPLVIFLHGSGEKGDGTTQLNKLTTTCLPNLMVTSADGGFPLQNLAVKNAIVVSPQCATNSGWSNPNEINPGGGLDTFIGRLLTEFDIDPQRVIVTGWSLGSGGTYDFTRLNPNRVAAMAPMSGAGGVSPVLLDIPLWGFHHLNDPSANANQHLQKIQELTTPSNGSVRPPPPGDSFLTYAKVADTKTWRDGGTVFDVTDPNVTLRFSWLVSATGALHSAGWKLAYNNPVFWNWVVSQTKSGTPINRPPVITATSPLRVVADVTSTSPVVAVDPEGQAVTLRFDAGTATFVSFAGDGGTGTLTVTPTAANIGTHAVTLTSQDTMGASTVSSVSVVVSAPVVTVTPSATSLAPLGTRTFTATARDPTGAVVTGLPLSWSVTGDAGAISDGGVFTAGTRAGTFANLVRATMGAGAGSATVTVTPGAVTSLTLAPTSITVAPGGTATFSATARDAYNNVVGGAVSWAVMADAGTISDGGVLSAGMTQGTYAGAVTASLGGRSASAAVVIQAGALARLALTPSDVQLAAGAQTTFIATGYDSTNAPVAITPVWSVVNGGGAITSSGAFTASSMAGDYVDTVQVEANQLAAFATVHVLPGPVSVVRVTPASVVLPIEATQRFSAEARDAFDNLVSTSFVWAADAAAGTVDTAGLFTAGLEAGDYPNAVRATASSVVGSASVALVSEDPIEETGDGGEPSEEADAGQTEPPQPSDAGPEPLADGGPTEPGPTTMRPEEQPPVTGGCGCGAGAVPTAAWLMLALRRRTKKHALTRI